MFAGTRRNMTLGFPDHLTKWELSDAYREAYLKDQKIIPHEIVDDGPVFENIMKGDDVDVTKFPSPVWHEKDGGRYIGTGTYSVTRDPEEKWLNAGAYRAMVHDKKTVGFVTAKGHHGWIHREKYFKRGEKMPVAMVVGGDPLCLLLRRRRGALRHLRARHHRRHARPPDQDGARARCTGLPFPANAEIVLEGYVEPGQDPRRKVRSANGPAITPAACGTCRCSTSRRSITATIRSSSACRRWAPGPTRWHATAP